MRQAMLLCSCCLIFLSSSCAALCPTPDPVRVVVTAQYEPCPRPAAPIYLPFSPAEHVGSPQNLNALLENAVRMRGYADAQGAALDCYESQAARPGQTARAAETK